MAFDPGEWLRRVRDAHPLVHNITNLVVMQISANTLLAAGASPVMAHAAEEVADMAKIAGALVLNIGTLEPAWVRSMELASRSAHTEGVPVVLDPVGVGATPYRSRIAQELLLTAHPHVVRGNAGEILALAGGRAEVKGVDAGAKTATREQVVHLARSTRGVVAATGAEDVVTDGSRGARVKNGHPMLQFVTGTGCSLSSLVGAYLAVARPNTDRYLEATVAALVAFEVAAEQAARQVAGPGSFHVAFLDALYNLKPEDVNRDARVDWD